MNLRKLIIEEIDGFDWVDEIKPFNLDNCEWIIETTNEKEWYEVEKYLFGRGWIWDDGNDEGSEYEGKFHWFFPSENGCDRKRYDASNEDYFYYGSEINPEFENHKFMKWSDVRNVMTEDFDWAEDIRVDPLHVGNFIYLDGTSDEDNSHGDWQEGQYIILRITDVTDDMVGYKTQKTNVPGEDHDKIDWTELKNARRLIKTRYWKQYNEKTGLFESEFDWADSWVNDTPTVGSEYYYDYDMGEPVLVRVVGVINDIVRFKNLDDDFISSHREMFYDDDEGWDVTDSIHLDGFMEHSKKVELNEDFDWVDNVDSMRLLDVSQLSNGKYYVFHPKEDVIDRERPGSPPPKWVDDYDGQIIQVLRNDRIERKVEFIPHGTITRMRWKENTDSVTLDYMAQMFVYGEFSEVQGNLTESEFDWAEKTPSAEKLPHWTGRSDGTEPGGSGRRDKVFIYTDEDGVRHSVKNGGTKYLGFDGVGGVSFYDSSITDQQIHDLNQYGADAAGDPFVGKYEVELTRPEYNQAVRDGRMILKTFDDFYPMNESEFDWADDAPSYDIKVGDEYSIPSVGKKDVRVRIDRPHGATKFKLTLVGGEYGNGEGSTYMEKREIINKLKRGFWINESDFKWMEKVEPTVSNIQGLLYGTKPKNIGIYGSRIKGWDHIKVLEDDGKYVKFQLCCLGREKKYRDTVYYARSSDIHQRGYMK